MDRNHYGIGRCFGRFLIKNLIVYRFYKGTSTVHEEDMITMPRRSIRSTVSGSKVEMTEKQTGDYFVTNLSRHFS